MTLTQSGPQAGPASPEEAARHTLDRARDHLLGLQDPAGWWQGELETNVTMDAEDLLLQQVLGVSDPVHTAAEARWIRSQQRADGTWATFYGGPGDLSTTIEAYVALRLAGDEPDEPHMRQAAKFVFAEGGLEASRVFTRIWLAMFGQWSWDDLPVIPPELIYLPAWFPLNIYDWACWARQTIVPLAVVGALRPARPLPFGLDELQTGAAPKQAERDPWALLFEGLDKALHVYESKSVGARWARNPSKSVRRAALRRCADWIIARQEKDGCWGGIQPPWVYSLLALHLLGWGLEHPVIQRGIAALDRFTITEQTPQGPARRLEACQSPVWDTVLAMNALADAGADIHDPAMSRAADWVLGEEIHGPGDWQVRRPDLAPGGWAFEFDNDGYPDTDDTAEVVLALRKCWPEHRGATLSYALPNRRAGQAEAAIQRGVRWMVGMQSKDGGWGAFDADNTRQLVNKLPFCDFGAVIDPPSADVTAHIVEALAAEGMAATKAARRGVTWLLKAQEPDGSWFGRWGANYVYGTGAVLPALIDAGVKRGKPCIRAAVRWLEDHQNDDGGWGEDLRSYDDPLLAGQGESTASQTAWALIGLLAAEGPEAVHSKAVQRGIEWLAQTQLDNGTWDEPLYTGTGFPGDFYINYHLYRLVFPISALGRYLRIAEQA
jgi:squalene-hopene/tetraprenyl-beta-curcumene cyclase